MSSYVKAMSNLALPLICIEKQKIFQAHFCLSTLSYFCALLIPGKICFVERV